jgi:carbonic anhydrase/acetyltransferase-like protein (isoleucine patch superfamily)
VTIGDDVTIGHRVVIHGCTIGDECLIGIGAIILDGTVVEDRVLLAAGSLVTEGKVLESGYLYLGSPARQVRPLTGEELSWFKYSAQHYVQLKNDHLVSV